MANEKWMKSQHRQVASGKWHSSASAFVCACLIYYSLSEFPLHTYPVIKKSVENWTFSTGNFFKFAYLACLWGSHTSLHPALWVFICSRYKIYGNNLANLRAAAASSSSCPIWTANRCQRCMSYKQFPLLLLPFVLLSYRQVCVSVSER